VRRSRRPLALAATIVATAGTSSVETTNEAIRIPTAIANPTCLELRSLLNISELNEAASTRPAAANGKDSRRS
jgi:hypothetical protein